MKCINYGWVNHEISHQTFVSGSIISTRSVICLCFRRPDKLLVFLFGAFFGSVPMFIVITRKETVQPVEPVHLHFTKSIIRFFCLFPNESVRLLSVHCPICHRFVRPLTISHRGWCIFCEIRWVLMRLNNFKLADKLRFNSNMNA